MQPDELADVVVLTVKAALAPVLERLAAAEGKLAQSTANETALVELRERLVAVETKAMAQPADVQAVDLSPALQRIAAAEARLDVLGDLRDRVVIVETKAAAPALEPSGIDLSPVLDRLSAVEVGLRMKFAETEPILGKVAELVQEQSVLRERVAVAETRQFIPGPMGRDGQPGRDGKDGKDGVDGLGYDELGVEQIDERSVKFKAMRGLHVKELGTLTFPVQIYRGVYQDGKSYERGDGVTWGGSEWHCNEATTTKPGDGSKAWTLKVKRGRDGKDGRDAMTAPVVSIGKR